MTGCEARAPEGRCSCLEHPVFKLSVEGCCTGLAWLFADDR